MQICLTETDTFIFYWKKILNVLMKPRKIKVTIMKIRIKPVNHERRKKINPAAENPEEFTGLTLGPLKKVAAGIPAVVSSFKHVFGEAGVLQRIESTQQTE